MDGRLNNQNIRQMKAAKNSRKHKHTQSNIIGFRDRIKIDSREITYIETKIGKGEK